VFPEYFASFHGIEIMKWKPDGQFYLFFNDSAIFKDCVASLVDE
jgi:hypothetical protein